MVISVPWVVSRGLMSVVVRRPAPGPIDVHPDDFRSADRTPERGADCVPSKSEAPITAG
jgi:hypothetical protein